MATSIVIGHLFGNTRKHKPYSAQHVTVAQKATKSLKTYCYWMYTCLRMPYLFSTKHPALNLKPLINSKPTIMVLKYNKGGTKHVVHNARFSESVAGHLRK